MHIILYAIIGWVLFVIFKPLVIVLLPLLGVLFCLWFWATFFRMLRFVRTHEK